MKTSLKIIAVLAIGFAATAPVHAAQMTKNNQVLQQIKLKIQPGVVELNGSDCRLEGGTVVTPGDDRCGKLGASYCRYPNGNAACLTE
jgi:hypothetical protein